MSNLVRCLFLGMFLGIFLDDGYSLGEPATSLMILTELDDVTGTSVLKNASQLQHISKTVANANSLYLGISDCQLESLYDLFGELMPPALIKETVQISALS